MTMTQSLEDYVEMIFRLQRECGNVKVSDIASSLAVTKPSVVRAIRELTKIGLVRHEPYRGVELTEKGKRVAKIVLNRHLLLREFLVKLGVGETTADRDACLMEHILSAETLDRIRNYIERK